MKLNLIKSIYRSKTLSQTEKSFMTSIVLNMDKDKKCTLPLHKLAYENSIATNSAWRIMRNLVKKNAVKRSECAKDARICTYEIAI